MIHFSRPVVALAFASALTCILGVSGASYADTEQKPTKTRYTNATDLKHDCPVYWNYPKPGLPHDQWQAGPSTTSKTVGVRYTAGGYALVLDYSRAPDNKYGRAGQFPWWGWVNQSCLIDPVARRFPDGTPGSKDRHDAKDPDTFAQPLPNRQAVGGNNEPKTVDVSPSSQGNPKKTIHFGSGGTLRSGPKQFAIGNVHEGWEFRIARDKCRTLTGTPFKPSQWVFGYVPQADRWGWVQASHLPACIS